MGTIAKRSLRFLVLLGMLVFLASCSKEPAGKPSTSGTPEGTKGGTSQPQAPATGTESEAPQIPQAGDHSMRVLNEPPEIKSAKFVGESGSTVQVSTEAVDLDHDAVTLRYAWTVNGQAVEAEGDTLTGLKRGDHVQVLITPSDGKQNGVPKGLFTIIQNHPPKITPTEPQYNDPLWSLQMNAADPDGDPLKYSLANGPSGMTVDAAGGLVSWNTAGVPEGKYSATVTVSDGQGGNTQYTFQIILSHEGAETPTPP